MRGGVFLMKKILVYLCFLALFSFFIYGAVFAEPMYVTDRLYLSLRDSPELEQSSVGVLQSDTRVEVLETEDDWAKVQLEDGRRGWVMKKYLTKDSPKALAITQLQGEIKKKSLTIENLRERINDMSLKIKELEEQVLAKSRIISERGGEVKDSSRAISGSGAQAGKLPAMVERLQKENASLKREITELSALREREGAMKKEIEELKKNLTQPNMKGQPSTGQKRFGKRNAAYLVGILGLLVGVVVGYLARRPDRNRVFLR
jgi:SH3 domain protein